MEKYEELNTWAKEFYEQAKSKGWHTTERSPLEYHALITSEIGEATDAVRITNMPIYQRQESSDGESYIITSDSYLWSDKFKPEGELTELADAVIRILDYCHSRNFDIAKAIRIKHAYNKNRSYRHGNKAY